MRLPPGHTGLSVRLKSHRRTRVPWRDRNNHLAPRKWETKITRLRVRNLESQPVPIENTGHYQTCRTGSITRPPYPNSARYQTQILKKREIGTQRREIGRKKPITNQ